MKRRSFWIVCVLIAIGLSTGWKAGANIRLPGLIAENMVLQQKMPVRIWGWADDGETVTVSIQGQTVTTTANGGEWWVTLKPLKSGGPFAMTLAGKNTIAFQNVLVGEVWVCSGQSNMEFHLQGAANAATVIPNSDDPLLRMFTVRHNAASEPLKDVRGSGWEVASPETTGHFSAVGYFFAEALRRTHHVPIGLIHASWGATRAEAWTSRPALESWGLTPAAFAKPIQNYTEFSKALDIYNRRLAVWKAEGSPEGPYEDPGNRGVGKGLAAPNTDTSDWDTMDLPTFWEKTSPEMEMDGGVWFRKEIQLPDSWYGKDLVLTLGAISDFDTTYFDGLRVGSTGLETSSPGAAMRRYVIPARILMHGKNVIAVRVWNRVGPGGFAGPPEAMTLSLYDPAGQSVPDATPISLAGPWLFKIETSHHLKPTAPPDFDPSAPSILYNGMIAPLTPFTIRGVLWYQGEANVGAPDAYRTLLPTLIQNWRTVWNEGDFPFLLVQLAPFKAINTVPEESNWAVLREAQALAARVVPNVGMAVITDVGDELDAQPKQKQPVGERLALLARKLAYGEKIVVSGPTFKSMQIFGNKAIVHFDNIGKGLDAHGERLFGFSIAGADGKFVWANAVLQKDRVMVSAPNVPHPTAVRYGWANYPSVNLWNKDGLPACPFRTDGPIH